VDRQYVGIDFHRRRSVIVRLNSAGERLAVARVANDPFEFASAIAAAGDAPAVVIEATYGWYWVVDLLQDLGATVHLANPKALNWGDRRVKNDVVDAADLADMLNQDQGPHRHHVRPFAAEGGDHAGRQDRLRYQQRQRFGGDD
jgi:transposase